MPRRRQIDPVLLGATLVAATVGVVMVGSASGPLARDYYHVSGTEFAMRQAIAVVLGLAGMLAATFAPLERVLTVRIALPLLGANWLALLVAYLQPTVAGTHRWLHLPIITFQPSALAKVTLPLALAAWLAHSRNEELSDRVTWRVALGLTVVTAGLVLFEPDLGSAILLFLGAASILVLAELHWRPLVLLGGGAAAVVAVAIALAPYRLARVLSFLGDPSYHVRQSLIALGSGGIVGRGPGESLQKLFFLPQPHSDFIFAIVGEELGFLGAVALLGLLGVVAWRGLVAAERASSRATGLLAGGLAATVAAQTLLNVSVCLNLLPAKGLPLPLVSAGGSDVAMTMVTIGLLLNVGKEGV